MTPSKVLIVEDEIIVAKDIEMKLKKVGHEVIDIVVSGEEAIEVALQQKPDLILMDIKLQGRMDGIEAAARIHAQSRIPLIYLTALSDDETLQRAKVTEPFAYIQKPITTRELHIATEIALYKHAVQRELSIQLQHMTAMRLIDQAIINSRDLLWTMRVILHQIAVQLEADATAVLLPSPYSGMLEYFQTYGFRSSSYTTSYIRSGQGFAGQVLSTSHSCQVLDLRETDGRDERLPWMLAEGFVSYIAYPLMSNENLVGVLEVFIRRPLDVSKEWFEFLEMLAQQAAIAVHNSRLMSDLSSANVEIIQSYNATILGLSAALEKRDSDTQGHCQRVADMTVKIAREMGVPNEHLDHVRRGALLHDIGKVGIPDKILLKPGMLDNAEWEVMRQHPVLAQDILASVPFLRPALEIPLYHHERWDGSGYPYGMKGDKIPLSARIFAVVDVWDALLSDRPYRGAWGQEKALEYIQEQAGTLFDPEVISYFTTMVQNHSKPV